MKNKFILIAMLSFMLVGCRQSTGIQGDSNSNNDVVNGDNNQITNNESEESRGDE